MPKLSGFTLIELLVVIAIISSLSVVGLVSYTNFMKSSRDSKRQSDLRLIQSSLEEFHSDLLFYPTAAGINSVLSSGGSFTSNTGIGSGAPPQTTKTYLNAMPKDPTPLTNTPYCYTATAANCNNSALNQCTSYTLYALLENPPVAASYSCGSSTYNFRVTLP